MHDALPNATFIGFTGTPVESTDKNTKAVFGEGKKEGVDEKLGKAVARQYGKGEAGFNISSCQFALHYFFESQNTFQNYLRNVSECTKVGGYFIGACYDGKLIYNLLKKKSPGESIEIYEDEKKVWEVRKEYDVDYFEDDMTSIGYKISVYQESINKMFPEFLVNFDYLERVMENYGFKLITRDEARSIGLPEGSGLFSELFNLMLDEIKKMRYKKNPYKSASDMYAYEKKISFLNRYFVYKKIRDVNAEKIALENLDETMEESRVEKLESFKAVKVAKEVVKTTKPKVRKLSNKLVLVPATEALAESEEPVMQVQEEQEEKKDETKEKKDETKEKKEKKERKPSVKKVKLVIEPEQQEGKDEGLDEGKNEEKNEGKDEGPEQKEKKEKKEPKEKKGKKGAASKLIIEE
jgi:hypothetical protein